MKIIKLASNNSVWRGLDYYNENKVVNYKKINDNEYKGVVKGSNNKKYETIINLEHSRSSKCNCPHANDKKIICKHMVALYFKIFPKEVDIFLKEVEESEKEYEKYEEELYKKTIKYINSMTKKQLIDSLVEILNTSPERIYERFVKDNVLASEYYHNID